MVIRIEHYTVVKLDESSLPLDFNEKEGVIFLDPNSLDADQDLSLSAFPLALHRYQRHDHLSSCHGALPDIGSVGRGRWFLGRPGNGVPVLAFRSPPTLDHTESSAITLRPEWLDNLEHPKPSRRENMNYSANILALCLNDTAHRDVPGMFLSCIANGLSLGVANALSYIPSFFIPEQPSSTFHEVETSLAVNVIELAYAYRLRGVVIYVAFAVLLLHVATVVAHVVAGLFARGWSTDVWASPGQLLVLALQSPEPPGNELAHCGVWVMSGRVW